MPASPIALKNSFPEPDLSEIEQSGADLLTVFSTFSSSDFRGGHIFVPTLVCAVPPQIGGTAEKWGGGHSKKNFPALRQNSCPSTFKLLLAPLVLMRL